MPFRNPYRRSTPPRKKTLEGSEQELQNACITFLEYRHWWVLRINSGMVKTQSGGVVKLAKSGVPDILALRPPNSQDPQPSHACPYWFEIKKPGKKSTPIQKARQDELRSLGCKVYEIHSLDELSKVL